MLYASPAAVEIPTAAALTTQQRPAAAGGAAAAAAAGVAQGLLERGVILPKVTPLSGLSGGAFTSTLTHLGLNGSAQAAFWQDLIAECSEMWGDCAGHINAIAEVRRGVCLWQ
jgi:hypothetical protein